MSSTGRERSAAAEPNVENRFCFRSRQNQCSIRRSASASNGKSSAALVEFSGEIGQITNTFLVQIKLYFMFRELSAWAGFRRAKQINKYESQKLTWKTVQNVRAEGRGSLFWFHSKMSCSNCGGKMKWKQTHKTAKLKWSLAAAAPITKILVHLRVERARRQSGGSHRRWHVCALPLLRASAKLFTSFGHRRTNFAHWTVDARH